MEIEETKKDEDFGIFSPMDDQEYNYLFDLIGNEILINYDKTKKYKESRVF